MLSDLISIAGENRPAAAAGRDNVDIGAKIGNLRKERNWTLSQTSKATGVAVSTLSKIERDDLSPTISTIQRIARGFGVDVLQLLADGEDAPALSGRRSVTRGIGNKGHHSGMCDNKLLCSDLKQKRMVPIYTRVVARSVDDYDVWPKSEMEIFLYVVKGTVLVHSRLYEPVELTVGDSMYYDANSEHAWTSVGPEDAELVWVMTG